MCVCVCALEVDLVCVCVWGGFPVLSSPSSAPRSRLCPAFTDPGPAPRGARVPRFPPLPPPRECPGRQGARPRLPLCPVPRSQIRKCVWLQGREGQQSPHPHHHHPSCRAPALLGVPGGGGGSPGQVTLTGKPSPPGKGGGGGCQWQLCWGGSASWSCGAWGEGESLGAGRRRGCRRGPFQGVGCW